MKNSIDLFSSNNELKMSSREIANITGKRHDNVLRDCDSLNDNYIKMSILKIEYVTSNGIGAIKIREALLNKMQCFDLLTGYNTELRIKVNRRWAELEYKEQTKIKLPQTFSEALQLAADQAKQLELQAPKVESYDMFIDSEALQGFKEVANLLGLGRNTMMRRLRELKIITNKNIPYQQYLNMGLFEVKESTQNGFSLTTTYVTPKGIEYIKNKLK